MASSKTDMKCLMCFEAKDVLKMVGECNHSFCMSCLSKHLESCISRALSCPTCRTMCELPDGDVDKLADVAGASQAASGVGTGGARPKVRNLAGTAVRDESIGECDDLVDAKCLLCFHNKKVVKAKNLCGECDQLYLCNDCTTIHAQNKATRDHDVVPVVPKSSQEDEMCPTHNALLTKYCTDCGKAVCRLCIMLEHADHDIEKLTDTIENKLEEVKNAVQQGEGDVTKLQCLSNKLGKLQDVVKSVTDKEEKLVKEIEDHAQKRIGEINAWTENTKEKLRKDFNVVRDFQETCDKAKDILKKLETSIPRAAKLLENRSNSPLYLDRLTSVGDDLGAVPKMEVDVDIDGDQYRFSLKELQKRNLTFTPSTQPLDMLIGKIIENRAIIIMKPGGNQKILGPLAKEVHHTSPLL